MVSSVTRQASGSEAMEKQAALLLALTWGPQTRVLQSWRANRPKLSKMLRELVQHHLLLHSHLVSFDSLDLFRALLKRMGPMKCCLLFDLHKVYLAFM